MRRLKIGLTLVIMLLGCLFIAFPTAAQTPKIRPSLGLIPSPPADYAQPAQQRLESIPESIDLGGGMPPVASQASQNSCVGWAIAYYYRSYQEGIENQRIPTTNGEIFSPSFIYNLRNTSDCQRDSGMTMANGLQIAVEQGVPTLETFPYNANDTCCPPPPEAFEEALLYRSSAYVNLFLGRGTADLGVLKAHLASGDPFLLAVPIYSEFYYAHPNDAVIDVPESGSTFYGGHAVTVVGYDDCSETFKIVNSWGPGWGDGGYGYLTYAFMAQNTWEAWALIDRDTTPPSLPDTAHELGGTESGVVQDEINSPIFTWTDSQDPQALYEICWGPDELEECSSITADPFFAPIPVNEPSTMYLRVRACDAAGNRCSWQTLFIFRYDPTLEPRPFELEAARIRTPGLAAR